MLRIATALILTSALMAASVRAESPSDDALLYRKVAIPGEFLTTKHNHKFGGDIRIGDLNGDGRCDVLVYRCNHGAPQGARQGGIKPTFLGAFDLDGKPIWQAGKGGGQPSRLTNISTCCGPIKQNGSSTANARPTFPRWVTSTVTDSIRLVTQDRLNWREATFTQRETTKNTKHED